MPAKKGEAKDEEIFDAVMDVFDLISQESRDLSQNDTWAMSKIIVIGIYLV